MAARNKVTRRRPEKAPKGADLLQLLLNAKFEVKHLLERNKAGTITNAELDRELQRVAASLRRVLDYTEDTLDGVSRLLQRNEARTLTKGQMNMGLRRVGRRLQHICNWGYRF